jgi:predicted 3-demethylubiquinone-9 3-methyltransferase (glyoxalase superfamily)
MVGDHRYLSWVGITHDGWRERDSRRSAMILSPAHRLNVRRGRTLEESAVPKITPFLWFDNQAEEAAEFYLSVFPKSRILDVARHGEGGPGPAGSVMTVHFELGDNEFVALNGGPVDYAFNESISFVIDCTTAAEVDHYWSLLTEGGEEIACGWLKDRYGVRWQVVPSELPAVLGDPDPERAKRAMEAMMTMKKLDIQVMKDAADGLVTPRP